MQIRTEKFWRWFSLLLLFLSIWYFFVQSSAVQALKNKPISPTQAANMPATWLALIFILLAVLILFVSFIYKTDVKPVKQMVYPHFVVWGFVAVLMFGSTIFMLLTQRTALWGVSGRIAFYVLVCGMGAWILSKRYEHIPPANGFLLLLLSAGVLYRIAVFVPELQTMPFALGWSEGSRYYNASLFFSQNIYGSAFPLPVLHPSRYLMQAIPFLIAPQNIFFHRFWQVILWVGVTFLGAYCIAVRISLKNRSLTIAITMWLFLFFFQGAVYYHLMVCVILVMLGYNKESFWKTLFFVLLASIWAGLSRVNWFPVPALLAVSIYLIEEPVKDRKWILYLKNPAIWTITGFVFATFSNRIYASLSGNEVSQFSSSFTSYMIWSRLLPNSTYPPGILFAVILVSLPAVLIMWVVFRKNGWKFYWHWIRVFGLSGILFIFALGGIIVSVKIGGGGDLHNMDAFLVFLAVISTYVVLNRFTSQTGMNSTPTPIPFILMLAVICVPVYFSFLNNATWKPKDLILAKADVQLIQKVANVVSEELPGPVLMIAERQLLTFGAIQGIELVPDYEKVFLMEMVMANNSIYLGNFHALLENHEYSAIIFDSLSEESQEKEDSFWVENNLWVDKVVIPILQSYESVYSLQDRSVNILIPRGNVDLYDQLKRMTP